MRNDPRETARHLTRLSEHGRDAAWETMRRGLALHSVQSVLLAVVELRDADRVGFERATLSIGRTGNPRYTRPLVRLLWETTSKGGALMVAICSCDPYFNGLYLRALQDVDPGVRAIGAQALTWPHTTWRSGQARGALLTMATNPSEDTSARWMAIKSLASFPKPARIATWAHAIVEASGVDSPLGHAAKVLAERWGIVPPDPVTGSSGFVGADGA